MIDWPHTMEDASGDHGKHEQQSVVFDVCSPQYERLSGSGGGSLHDMGAYHRRQSSDSEDDDGEAANRQFGSTAQSTGGLVSHRDGNRFYQSENRQFRSRVDKSSTRDFGKRIEDNKEHGMSSSASSPALSRDSSYNSSNGLGNSIGSMFHAATSGQHAPFRESTDGRASFLPPAIDLSNVSRMSASSEKLAPKRTKHSFKSMTDSERAPEDSFGHTSVVDLSAWTPRSSGSQSGVNGTSEEAQPDSARNFDAFMSPRSAVSDLSGGHSSGMNNFPQVRKYLPSTQPRRRRGGSSAKFRHTSSSTHAFEASRSATMATSSTPTESSPPRYRQLSYSSESIAAPERLSPNSLSGNETMQRAPTSRTHGRTQSSPDHSFSNDSSIASQTMPSVIAPTSLTPWHTKPPINRPPRFGNTASSSSQGSQHQRYLSSVQQSFDHSGQYSAANGVGILSLSPALVRTRSPPPKRKRRFSTSVLDEQQQQDYDYSQTEDEDIEGSDILPAPEYDHCAVSDDSDTNPSADTLSSHQHRNRRSRRENCSIDGEGGPLSRTSSSMLLDEVGRRLSSSHTEASSPESAYSSLMRSSELSSNTGVSVDAGLDSVHSVGDCVSAVADVDSAEFSDQVTSTSTSSSAQSVSAASSNSYTLPTRHVVAPPGAAVFSYAASDRRQKSRSNSYELLSADSLPSSPKIERRRRRRGRSQDPNNDTGEAVNDDSQSASPITADKTSSVPSSTSTGRKSHVSPKSKQIASNRMQLSEGESGGPVLTSSPSLQHSRHSSDIARSSIEYSNSYNSGHTTGMQHSGSNSSLTNAMNSVPISSPAQPSMIVSSGSAPEHRNSTVTTPRANLMRSMTTSGQIRTPADSLAPDFSTLHRHRTSVPSLSSFRHAERESDSLIPGIRANDPSLTHYRKRTRARTNSGISSDDGESSFASDSESSYGGDLDVDPMSRDEEEDILMDGAAQTSASLLALHSSTHQRPRGTQMAPTSARMMHQGDHQQRQNLPGVSRQPQSRVSGMTGPQMGSNPAPQVAKPGHPPTIRRHSSHQEIKSDHQSMVSHSSPISHGSPRTSSVSTHPHAAAFASGLSSSTSSLPALHGSPSSTPRSAQRKQQSGASPRHYQRGNPAQPRQSTQPSLYQQQLHSQMLLQQQQMGPSFQQNPGRRGVANRAAPAPHMHIPYPNHQQQFAFQRHSASMAFAEGLVPPGGAGGQTRPSFACVSDTEALSGNGFGRRPTRADDYGTDDDSVYRSSAMNLAMDDVQLHSLPLLMEHFPGAPYAPQFLGAPHHSSLGAMQGGPRLDSGSVEMDGSPMDAPPSAPSSAHHTPSNYFPHNMHGQISANQPASGPPRGSRRHSSQNLQQGRSVPSVLTTATSSAASSRGSTTQDSVAPPSETAMTPRTDRNSSLLMKATKFLHSLYRDIQSKSVRNKVATAPYYVPQRDEVLSGRYRVIEILGRGSFGVVVSAVVLDNPVASPGREESQQERESTSPEMNTMMDGQTSQEQQGSKNRSGYSKNRSRRTRPLPYDPKREELLQPGRMVAIKISRKGNSFVQQGEREVSIIDQIHEFEKHQPNQDLDLFVRALDTFFHEGHFAIVFELLANSLFSLVKSSWDVRPELPGLSLRMVRKLTHQILCALITLKNMKVIHCDLKPENIALAHRNRPRLKILDFGSSCFLSELPTDKHPYIQSRYYRAPEILLGTGYSCAIDMWSLGCLIAELYLGRPLFEGSTTITQLYCIIDVLGMPTDDLLRNAAHLSRYFNRAGVDNEGRSLLDPTVQHPFMRTSLREIIESKNEPNMPLHIRYFTDLITRMLEWDPAQRITPLEAVNHNFILYGPKKPADGN